MAPPFSTVIVYWKFWLTGTDLTLVDAENLICACVEVQAASSRQQAIMALLTALLGILPVLIIIQNSNKDTEISREDAGR